MSIYVEVKTERGEVVEGVAGFRIQPIVTWPNRSSFPMLAHIDPFGHTVFNRPQVRTLQDEILAILDACARDGVLQTARSIGADQADESTGVPGWDLERDVVGLLQSLRMACEAAAARQHRYLWFFGD